MCALNAAIPRTLPREPDIIFVGRKEFQRLVEQGVRGRIVPQTDLGSRRLIVSLGVCGILRNRRHGGIECIREFVDGSQRLGLRQKQLRTPGPFIVLKSFQAPTDAANAAGATGKHKGTRGQ